MTTPTQQSPAWPSGYWPPRRILLVVAAVLFVIGAFAFGGDALGSISGAVWDSAAAAAWMLSAAAP